MTRRVGFLAVVAVVLSTALLLSHYRVWARAAHSLFGPKGSGGVETP